MWVWIRMNENMGYTEVEASFASIVSSWSAARWRKAADSR